MTPKTQLEPDRGAQRYGRFQFSLRTLLAFCILAGLAAGWIAAWYKPRWERRKANESFSGAMRKFQPRMLATDRRASLEFENPKQLRDSDLVYLKELSAMQYQLERLDLKDTAITGEGLAHLRYVPDLEYLDLQSTKINSSDLVQLKGLRRLKWLNLCMTQVDDSAILILAQLPCLEYILLSSTGITDEGARQLAELQNLRAVWLGRTRVSDAGLAHLERLRRLEKLVIHNTSCTLEGLKKFRTARPGCYVD